MTPSTPASMYNLDRPSLLYGSLAYGTQPPPPVHKKDKSLFVLYWNTDGKPYTKNDLDDIRRHLSHLEYKYDILVLGVHDQKTKIKIFDDDKNVNIHKKVLDTEIEKLEDLINK